MKEVIPEAIKDQVMVSISAQEELDMYIMDMILAYPAYKDDPYFPKRHKDEVIKDYKGRVDAYMTKTYKERKPTQSPIRDKSKFGSNYTPPKKRK